MKNFKHYIVTRFNLSNKWEEDKNGNITLNNDWLEERYSLFENYCFSSLKAQSNKNFEWWVYFDDSLSNQYKEKNKLLSKSMTNFLPKYEFSYQDFEKNYILDIKKDIIRESLDFVITTRLDNDDALHCDFVNIIQKKKFNQDIIIEFPVGLTLTIFPNKELRRYYSRYNPFISLVEKVDNKTPKGIYSRDHGNWRDMKTEIITNEPYWIQTIHKRNVYNQPKGKLVLPHFLKKFNIIKIHFTFEYKYNIILKKIKKTLKYIIKQ